VTDAAIADKGEANVTHNAKSWSNGRILWVVLEVEEFITRGFRTEWYPV
jgi:hypothetical protein